ncbi:hypothetical protein Hdeb2414_s0011g00366721 [Helianthus debilis subsp. tardiflorus]
MKTRGVALFLVVLFTLAIISSAGRTHQTTTRRLQDHRQTGTVKADKVAHPNNDWGGCWGCWNHDRRRLFR